MLLPARVVEFGDKNYLGACTQGVFSNKVHVGSIASKAFKGVLYVFFLKAFLRGIILLDGLGDDGAGGVAALVVLTLSGDGSSHVAGRESQCDRCTRHNGRRESDDDFVDTLFVHIRRFF